jgi:hypothetical protein
VEKGGETLDGRSLFLQWFVVETFLGYSIGKSASSFNTEKCKNTISWRNNRARKKSCTARSTPTHGQKSATHGQASRYNSLQINRRASEA